MEIVAMAKTIIGKLDRTGIVKSVESKNNDIVQLGKTLVKYYNDERKIDTLLANQHDHSNVEIDSDQESFIDIGELIRVRPYISHFHVWVYGKWRCFNRYGDPTVLEEI